MPVYSIVFSSFCVTLIFYLSMLLFVFYTSLVRLVSVVIPRQLSQIVDAELVKDNSIAVVFCLGSFSIIALYALVNALFMP